MAEIRDCCDTSPGEDHAADCSSPAGREARDKRRRRWRILAEDGAIFGLTPRESAELRKLEGEFGATGLPESFRS